MNSHVLCTHRRVRISFLCTLQLVLTSLLCTRHLLRIGFLRIISHASIVCAPFSSYASVFPCTRHLVFTSFLCTSARTHPFFRAPVGLYTSFSDHPSDCTHEFYLCMHAFTVCALTKYTPPFLINGSCPSPTSRRISLLSVFSTLFHTSNLHSRSASSRSPRENHIVSSDRKFSTRSATVRILGAVFRLHF